jgi:Tat protein translocase TatB subunit
MFGMGMNEILIVLAIAVIVIGPKQLPQMARAMGKMVAQFKRATNDLRNTISDEVSQHVPMDEFNEMKDTLESGVRDLQDHSRALVQDEFGDDKKIGGEIVSDLKSAYSDIPTEIPTEIDLGSGNEGDSQTKSRKPQKRLAAKGGKGSIDSTGSTKKNRAAAASKGGGSVSRQAGKGAVVKPVVAKGANKGNGVAKRATTGKGASARRVSKGTVAKATRGTGAKSRQGRSA